MKHSFVFTPTVIIEISDEDFNLLMLNMSKHYDISIKMATEVGGFMYGNKNRRDFDNTDKEVELSNRQLQLLIKSLELNSSEEALKLSSELWKILKEMSSVTEKVNEKVL